MSPTRRDFLKTAAGTVGLAAAGTIIIPELASALPARVDATVAVTLAEHAELKAANSVLVVESDLVAKPILLIHGTGDKYLALSSRCQHKGCVVEFKPEEMLLRCPCHGSEYSLTGAVTKGPSQHDLIPYPVEVKNGVATISIAPPPAPPK